MGDKTVQKAIATPALEGLQQTTSGLGIEAAKKALAGFQQGFHQFHVGSPGSWPDVSLQPEFTLTGRPMLRLGIAWNVGERGGGEVESVAADLQGGFHHLLQRLGIAAHRSEERRVGKED